MKPDYINQLTHLILDEIHERSVDSDLLYVVIKKLLERKGKRLPRLVLMSATFDTENFKNYFFKKAVNAIHVGVHRFPVVVHYLESERHTLSFLKHPVLQKISPLMPCPLTNFSLKYRAETQVTPQQVEVFVWLCCALAEHAKQTQVGTVILAFFPGMEDIETCSEKLEKVDFQNLLKRPNPDYIKPVFEIMMMHSALDDTEQDMVFSPILAGTTRVILSTNISESSVTIPNVAYVVDFGLKKEIEYIPKFGCDSLFTVYTSQASAKQRAGRCGRVCPGSVFRLYGESCYLNLPSYDTPELVRVSLAPVILRMKAHAGASVQDSPYACPRQLLEGCIDPPSIENIQIAFNELVQLGALNLEQPFVEVESNADYSDSDSGSATSSNDNDEQQKAMDINLANAKVTPMGELLTSIPLGLAHGKIVYLAMRLGASFVPSAVLIACILSEKQFFVFPHRLLVDYVKMQNAVTRGRMLADEGRLCDIIASLQIIKQVLIQSTVTEPWELKAMLFLEQGILEKRVKIICREAKEIADRILPLFPSNCKEALLELKDGLSFQKRAPNSHARSHLLERLIPLDEASCAVLHTVLVAALWNNLCHVDATKKLRENLDAAQQYANPREMIFDLPKVLYEDFESQLKIRDTSGKGSHMRCQSNSLNKELISHIESIQLLKNAPPKKSSTYGNVPMLSVKIVFKEQYVFAFKGNTMSTFTPTAGEISFIRVIGGLEVANPRPPIPGLASHLQQPENFEILGPAVHPAKTNGIKTTLVRRILGDAGVRGGSQVYIQQSVVPHFVNYRYINALLGVKPPAAGAIHLYGFSPSLMSSEGNDKFRTDRFSFLPFGSPIENLRASLILLLAAPCELSCVRDTKKGAEASTTGMIGLQSINEVVQLPADVPRSLFDCIAVLRTLLHYDLAPQVDAGEALLFLMKNGYPPLNLDALRSPATEAFRAKLECGNDTPLMHFMDSNSLILTGSTVAKRKPTAMKEKSATRLQAKTVKTASKKDKKDARAARSLEGSRVGNRPPLKVEVLTKQATVAPSFDIDTLIASLSNVTTKTAKKIKNICPVGVMAAAAAKKKYILSSTAVIGAALTGLALDTTLQVLANSEPLDEKVSILPVADNVVAACDVTTPQPKTELGPKASLDLHLVKYFKDMKHSVDLKVIRSYRTVRDPSGIGFTSSLIFFDKFPGDKKCFDDKLGVFKSKNEAETACAKHVLAYLIYYNILVNTSFKKKRRARQEDSTAAPEEFA